jgi:four helix bundle protein
MEKKKESVLSEQSLHFAVRILSLSKRLQKTGEFIVSKQIGKSGTSIGANIKEAQYASSRADFIAKLHIALKEANETVYWLDLLQLSKEITDPEYTSLLSDCRSIRAMLVASINTAKAGAQSEKQE